MSLCNMSSKFVLFFLVLFVFVGSCLGALEDKVSYYEVLSLQSMHTRRQRSVGSHGQQHQAEHEMTLSIFNMTLDCHLRPRKNMFSPAFKLVVIDGRHRKEITDFDKDQFLVGTCEGDTSSHVEGYFTDGRFEGSITYNGVVYGIESARRHLKERNAGELHGKMIAYRSSDMKWETNQEGKGPKFCGASHVDDSGDHIHTTIGSSRHTHPKDSSGNPSRKKRQISNQAYATCRLVAIADYKFYRFIGNREIYDTATYIASVIGKVDSIYRKTTFNLGSTDGQVTNLGFEIAEMQINVNPTTGYNADRTDWETLELLQTFGRDLYFSEFCLAHLFTHQQFSGNVLGLAYIASQTVGSAGGICSPTRKLNKTDTSLNTGWSTTLNSNGDTVLAQQASLVTAHGHNWGAEHDPGTDECSPSTLFGSGKYLMYAYSVNGYDSNNDLFSPCSKRDIAAVLASKRKSCFTRTPDASNKCGNGIVDDEEQCDAGYLGRFNLDPCCSSQCLLVGTAKCSGVSLACPTPPSKPKGASCLDLGQCDGNGRCQSFCEARGKMSCTCDQVSESCQRCCRDNSTAECKPFDNNHPLPNSRPCVIGYCQSGVCIKSENSAIQRLFDILEKLSIDGILEFFRNNLVGVIIIFSLILWIPLSCCISYKDRKLRQSLKKQAFVDLREDRDFLYDEDGRRIAQPSDGPSSSTPRTPGDLAPRRLPPLMSPRNKELVHQRNRIMPMSPLAGADFN
ncbi:hypothetical protein ACOMHN_000950 [Nucella lapillus]